MLGRHVAQARRIVVKLLDVRLTLEPETRDGLRGLRLHAVDTVAKLVSGVVPSKLSCLQVVASPRGFAPSRNPLFSVSLAFDGVVRLAA